MLEGKTAFVTGASRGIGRDIANKLAEHGANVTLAARSDGIYDAAEEIGEDQALPVNTDVTDEQNIEDSIEATVEEFGGLDILVNNAGVSRVSGTAGDHTGGPLETISEEAWQKVQDVNVLGPFLCSKHAIPHLRRSDRASIINIGSVAGKSPYTNGSPYAASKMALIGMTRTLASEVGEDGITVNTICPGPTESSEGDRLQNVFSGIAAEDGVSMEEAKATMFDDQAIKQAVHSREIGELTAMLAGAYGKHISGQDINVDSGLSTGH